MSRLYLDVPFAQKDAAKRLGARWDPRRRKWYLPDPALLDHAPELRQWLPPADVAPPAPSRRPHKASATQLAQLARCEQQAVFDRLYGRARSDHMRQRQKEGLAAHKAYELRVASGERPRASPCFIATATFGPDAFETWTLRRWRNRRLATHALGRGVIRLYERVSPPLARRLATRPRMARCARAGLRLFIAALRV